MMKFTLIFTALFFTGCHSQSITKQATIVEMVLFETKPDISKKEAQIAMTSLNTIVNQQKGFLGRKTSVGKDGQFLDLVYWDNLENAQKASKAIMENPKASAVFQVIEESSMIFKHFEIFNIVTK